MFWGAKKNLNFFFKYCSVCTEKLHRIKVNKSQKNVAKYFLQGKNQVFLGLKIWASDQSSVCSYCDQYPLIFSWKLCHNSSCSLHAMSSIHTKEKSKCEFSKISKQKMLLQKYLVVKLKNPLPFWSALDFWKMDFEKWISTNSIFGLFQTWFLLQNSSLK